MSDKNETHVILNVELTRSPGPLLPDDLVIYCEDGHLVVRGKGLVKIPWPKCVGMVLPNARKKLQSFFDYDRMVNDFDQLVKKRYLTRDEWIIEVRKLVTAANAEITVAEVFQIFEARSDEMVVLHLAYARGRTPQQAYDLMIELCGKRK